MIRTQIQLTDQQSKLLKALAMKEGVSAAELIRRSIDQYLQHSRHRDREDLKQKAFSIIGKYASGLDDVGENHDTYLVDAYSKVHQ